VRRDEAQQKLADYIEEYTGKLIHQGESIETFADLWKAFSAVKAVVKGLPKELRTRTKIVQFRRWPSAPVRSRLRIASERRCKWSIRSCD
jgi:hypothetical protein